MSHAEDQPWRARIRRPDGRVVGAGFLVDGRQVVTCAHVVADALGVSASGPRPERSEGKVLVDFPAAEVAAPLSADVYPDGWTPVGANDRGDVAVLQLQGDPPAEMKPAPLRQPSQLAGHQISTFGYPRKIEYGEWAHGTVSGPGGPGGQWVQLEAATVTGRRIEGGFSGAAVYDHTAGGVVGMVVAEDTQAEAKIAWMLPTKILARYWPPLADLIPSRLRLDPAFRSHWQPRGRGVDVYLHEGWYFTGRTQVLRELVAWLQARPGSDHKARVVTGSPGSGKSAVLARLVTLADPTTRAEVPDEVLAKAAEGTIPDLGSVQVAVHAAGKTTQEVIAGIADAAGITATSPQQLVEELLGLGGPLTIVVDALDEASDATQLARTLLQPLAVHGGRRGIRLLVGTRRELVGLLQAGAKVLDLDEPAYHDRDDLVGYVGRLLTGTGDPATTTPYQHQPELARRVAEAVAAPADPSFLIAQLVALDLTDRSEPVDTSYRGWQAQFPDTVGAAMDDYLARYGPDEQRVTDLFRPLVWAQGAGLSDDQVWAEVATALGTAAYHDYDVRLVRDTTIGTLLQATPTEDGIAYRLFHEALAEHLRSNRADQSAHRAYTRVLLAHSPRQEDREPPDWAAASGYIRTHLAVHAAHAGQLDQLIADPAFVLHANLDRLLGVLRHATTPAGRTTAGTIQRASHHLRGGPLEERAAYLQLVARQHGDTALAKAIDHAGLPLAWRTLWAFWRPQAPYRVMGHHVGLSTLAVVALPNGQAIAITGGHDGTIRLWDLPSGTPRTNNLSAHDREVEQLAVATLPNGQPIAITAGGRDGTIRLWDLQTGTPRTDNLPAHDGPIWELATTSLPDGQAIAITAGGRDGTIRLWDLQTGTPLSDMLHAHTGPVQQLATTILPNRQAIAITGDRDGTIRLWDLQTGTPLSDMLHAHTGPVQQLATTTLPNRQAIAITGGHDGTIRLWDLPTGTPRTTNLPAHETGVLYVGGRGGVQQLAITSLPDGQPIAITAGHDGTIRLWNLATGTPRTDNLPAHQPGDLSGGVQQLATASLPDGQPIAITGGSDGTIRLWNLQTGTPRTDNLRAHQPGGRYGRGGVQQLAVATLPDDQPIAITAGGDRVCIYDLSAGCIRRQISIGSRVQAIALMPDGLVVIGAQMGLLGLRDVLPRNK